MRTALGIRIASCLPLTMKYNVSHLYSAVQSFPVTYLEDYIVILPIRAQREAVICVVDGDASVYAVKRLLYVPVLRS